MPASVENPVKIQAKSPGVLPELVQGYRYCRYTDADINARDEDYYFPCSKEHECCGRECCVRAAFGFPVWLAWLLGILLFLLLLLLLLCLIYWCWRYCNRTKAKPSPPSPRPRPVIVQAPPAPPPEIQTYRGYSSGNGTLHRVSDSNLVELKNGGMYSYTPSTNTMTTVVSMPSSRAGGGHYSESSETVEEREFGRRSRPRRRRNRDWHDDEDDWNAKERPFVPSPMHESYESSPTPIRVTVHDESEFTQERYPLMSQIQTPDQQKVRKIYVRPGSDQVASYNELPKPSDKL